MDVKIKYDKLVSSFEKIMKEYTNLDYTEKSYDDWVFDDNKYIDMNVINFYLDIDEDYEDDNWVMQYQDNSLKKGADELLPILRYGYPFNTPQIMFNQYFDKLLKDWFEKVYGYNVKTIEKMF